MYIKLRNPNPRQSKHFVDLVQHKQSWLRGCNTCGLCGAESDSLSLACVLYGIVTVLAYSFPFSPLRNPYLTIQGLVVTPAPDTSKDLAQDETKRRKYGLNLILKINQFRDQKSDAAFHLVSLDIIMLLEREAAASNKVT